MKKSLYITAASLYLFTQAAFALTIESVRDKIIALPGFGVLNNEQFSGYLPISSLKNKHHENAGQLFYWLATNTSRDKQAPLLLWLNGGPGAASLYGLFMENGPFHINNEGKPALRTFSWSKLTHYLMIDQPAGVGFSYGTKDSYQDENEAIDQLFNALMHFYHRYPRLGRKPLYLAGESYAGKYIPKLAQRIIDYNKHNASDHIRLEGLMLGDAWVNPKLQQKANIQYAYTHGLIDHNAQKSVKELYEQCIKEIDKQSPSSVEANKACEKIQSFIQEESGHLNLANIAKGSEPDDKPMVSYLNNPQVRKALHVDSRVKQFDVFNEMAASKLERGEQDSVADLYPLILQEGIRVLLYNGLDDGKDSNFLSTDLWLSALDWPYRQAFANTKTCVWSVDGTVAGYAKSAKGLTQVKIRNAGHLAPIDEPKRLFVLLEHFIHNQPLCTPVLRE